MPTGRVVELCPDLGGSLGHGQAIETALGTPVTPAMAARITDHVWTTQELLSYRVPAFFLDRLHEFNHLFQPIEDTRQGS
jgi:hypothetical protein